MYFGLGREKGEALLLGMTATFVNHVFFVRPIAELIYGATAAQLEPRVDNLFWHSSDKDIF